MPESEDRPQPKPRRKTSSSSRKTSSTRKTRSTGSPERKGSTPDFSATADPAAALNIEQDHFTPPDESVPADVDDDLEPYAPIAAEPIDWTPERAGTIVRAGGYLLHTADSVAREPGGEELWRATEADIEAIASPLARILNRYEPVRRVAGYSDEGELMLGLAGYARRNLADRGRLVTAKREAEAALAEQGGFMARPFEQPPEHEQQ